MKIRNGFVSNSSSSSFVLIGTRISFDNREKIDSLLNLNTKDLNDEDFMDAMYKLYDESSVNDFDVVVDLPCEELYVGEYVGGDSGGVFSIQINDMTKAFSSNKVTKLIGEDIRIYCGEVSSE